MAVMQNSDGTPNPTEPITALVENEKPLTRDELLDAVRVLLLAK